MQIRLPRSGGRQSRGFCKLIEKVLANRGDAFAWEGRFFRPGDLVDEQQMRLPGWPDRPLLLEYVPAVGAPSGWRRHRYPDTWILWTWSGGSWRELGRADALGGDGASTLKSLALAHLAPPPLAWRRTLTEARERIVAAVDAELEAVEEGRKAALLSVVHDVIASRAVFLSESVGKEHRHTDKSTVVGFSLLSLPYMPAENRQSAGGQATSPVGPSEWNSTSPLAEFDAKATGSEKKTLAQRQEFEVESEAVNDLRLTKADRAAFRKAGSIGGKKVAAKMTPEQRIERAKRAGRARWAKRASAAAAAAAQEPGDQQALAPARLG